MGRNDTILPVSVLRLASEWRRHALPIVAACVGLGLAHIPSSTMPFQIGALIDGSLRSSSQAGLFASSQIGALAVSMIAVSSQLHRYSPRSIALVGCLLTASANVGLFCFQAFYLQIALAGLSGVGYGLVFAATVAGAAKTVAPDTTYAIGNGGALLIIVGLLSVIPSVASVFGPLGIFMPLAALALACAPLAFVFDRGSAQDIDQLPAWRTPGAIGLLFSWAAYSTGSGAVYAFSERIGRSIPLNPQAIGTVLSLGVFVGVLGTAVAAFLGPRVDRKWALLAGMCGTALASLLLGLSNTLTLFAAGIFLYWIFNMFLYSYLLGTAAALDAGGRVGTLGGGFERFGYALGAGIGGVLAEHIGYGATGIAGFVGCIAGLAIGFPSLFRALGRLKHPQTF